MSSKRKENPTHLLLEGKLVLKEVVGGSRWVPVDEPDVIVDGNVFLDRVLPFAVLALANSVTRHHADVPEPGGMQREQNDS